MTHTFCESLIDLRRAAFASQSPAEFYFEHYVWL
jgi:hypothetical protein